MVKQVISLTDVVNKPLNAVESAILSRWRQLATDVEKTAQIEYWFSSIQGLWPSVVRFSLHDPGFNDFCHRAELQSLWWDIWAGFGVSLLEHQQKEPIFFLPQQDFHPFDLCVGAHFFGLSIKAKRTIALDYSKTELAFLRYAIEHYPSIHAAQRYNAYLYQQLQPAKWCSGVDPSVAESLFATARDNCLALLPAGKYVLGDNAVGYGSYAYMLLAESYVRWLSYSTMSTAATNEALSAIQSCMQYAEAFEPASAAAIINASFGTGFRAVDAQGVEWIGLAEVQHYINSQLINRQPVRGSSVHATTTGHWQSSAKRKNKQAELTPPAADVAVVNNTKTLIP